MSEQEKKQKQMEESPTVRTTSGVKRSVADLPGDEEDYPAGEQIEEGPKDPSPSGIDEEDVAEKESRPGEPAERQTDDVAARQAGDGVEVMDNRSERQMTLGQPSTSTSLYGYERAAKSGDEGPRDRPLGYTHQVDVDQKTGRHPELEDTAEGDAEAEGETKNEDAAPTHMGATERDRPKRNSNSSDN